MPETKDRSLEQMEKKLREKSAVIRTAEESPSSL